MSKFYVLLDPMQIQRFIFATNKMSIIIGSSLALAQWQETCSALCQKQSGEMLTIGGGNVLASFAGEPEADEFKKRAIGAAPPGLEIAWAIAKGEGGSASEDSKIWDALHQELSSYKAGNRPPSDYPTVQPMESASCRYCGVRAEDGELDNKRICSQCRDLHKRGSELLARHNKKTPVEQLYVWAEKNGFPGCFPKELDALTAREKVASNDLMAAVVVDLNSISHRIVKIVKENGFLGLKVFSEELDRYIRDISKGIIEQISKWPNGIGTNPDSQSQDKFIRIRPLFIGGDDMVFVVPAPFWPALVQSVLEDISSKGFSACAGIAVAKDSFPINRLVEMAEELTAHAKKLVRYNNSLTENPPPSNCAIDWHVHQEASFASPLEVRGRTYTKRRLGGRIEIMTERPYTLEAFADLLNKAEGIGTSNRKLHILHKALRDGMESTRDMLVYTFLRDESDELKKYSFLWDLLKGINGSEPLWQLNLFSNNSKEYSSTSVADILELKFIQDS